MLSTETIISRIVSNALKKAIAREIKEELRNTKKCIKDESNRIKEELKYQSRIFKKAMKTKLPDDDNDIFEYDCDVSMTYARFLDKKRIDFIRENDRQIIKDVENREHKLCAKIRSYMAEKMTDDDTTDFTFEKILAEIRTNAMVRSFFRKDPVRQSIHEKSQVEWLRIKLLPDVVKLNGAVGGLYFNDYRLTNVHPRPISASKTLDIYSAETNTYGVLKFSTTVGGAQDNQFTDVKIFIQQMIGYIDSSSHSSERFMFFLDGPYYTESKLENIRMMIPIDKSDKIIITSVARI